MQSLQYCEHISDLMTEPLSFLAKDFDHAQLGDEILREIAGMTFSAQDTKGLRAFSRFRVNFSEESPRLVLKQISLLLEYVYQVDQDLLMGIVKDASLTTALGIPTLFNTFRESHPLHWHRHHHLGTITAAGVVGHKPPS